MTPLLRIPEKMRATTPTLTLCYTHKPLIGLGGCNGGTREVAQQAIERITSYADARVAGCAQRRHYAACCHALRRHRTACCHALLSYITGRLRLSHSSAKNKEEILLFNILDSTTLSCSRKMTAIQFHCKE